MRYLITGGAGFIGSHLTDALVARSDEVVILDDLSTGRMENIAHLSPSAQVRFVKGSVLDTGVVSECLAETDACFHLASAVGVQLIVGNTLESLTRNIRGNDVVLTAAAEHGRRILFTSTSEIYGKNSSGPLTEDADRLLGSPFTARWTYATAKAFGESLAHCYFEERGTATVVARLFNTVGPRQSGAYGMVLPRFVRQALAGQELTVFGTGSQSRCFAHVADTVHALVLLMDCDAATGSVFNVGSSEETAIIELAAKVIERTGSDATVRLVPYDEAYGEGFEELGRRKPETTRLRDMTGWAPSRGVDEAIDDLVAYERSQAAAGRLRLAG
jgi:UDP-glucose 4-epimerase